ncbi:MAG: iron chelate uptake ABC transporter family permease subunit [Thermoplasmata archaeon]
MVIYSFNTLYRIFWFCFNFGRLSKNQHPYIIKDVHFVYLIILLSFLIAPSVAVSGSIGFVGLIAPHIMRVWETSDYKWLIPSSFLAGSSLLLASDILARVLFYPTEIPVGIVTSFLGFPFFLYLIIKR